MELVIFNLGQVTKMIHEKELSLPNFHTTPIGHGHEHLDSVVRVPMPLKNPRVEGLMHVKSDEHKARLLVWFEERDVHSLSSSLDRG
ncbi:hypothetical protein TNCV_21491 [Trichonephila clavipes]|nr:hypothetical protein TNCV_21491 [Trichonephila clavipes]